MASVATMVAEGLGLGHTKLHAFSPKHPSPFLGKKLRPQSQSLSLPSKRSISNLVCATGGGFSNLVQDVFLGVGVGLPCTVMECGDIIYRSTLPRSNGLTLTAPGAVLALGVLSYLWATPGVAPGFFDMFVLAFAERLFRPTFKKVCELWVILDFFYIACDWVLMEFVLFGLCWQEDIVLGKKLGEGAFGVVYRVSLANKSGDKV